MCGRYSSSTEIDELVESFRVSEVRTEALEERYNVAPTTTNYAVLERAKDGDVRRQLRGLRWGLVPSWAKDLGVGNRMINARVESLLDKSVFAIPLARRRCLVPADGYYEWYAEPGRKAKQPFFVRHRDGSPMALAGLYEIWRDPATPDGELVWSYSIVTTEANDALRHIHDRMPAMLAPDRWDAWLDPARADAEEAAAMLRPAPSDLVEAYAVSTLVNNVRNEGPELLDPVPSDDLLF